MSESRAAGWPSDGPTAAQMKEFFGQIESGRINKERLQSFLRSPLEGPLYLMQSSDLRVPIDVLELGMRTQNCLKRVGIVTIGDLIEKSERDLAAVPNLGNMRIPEIRAKLADHGLALRGESPPSGSREKAEPTADNPLIDMFFELGKLLNVKIDLTHMIAEHRFSHHSYPEELDGELSDTSAEINALLSRLAGLIVGTAFGSKPESPDIH